MLCLLKIESFCDIACMKMRIEPNGSGGRGKMSSESRKGKRRQRKMSAVQKLYEICKEVFADCGPGIVPSPENVEKLSAFLGIQSISFFHFFLFLCVILDLVLRSFVSS